MAESAAGSTGRIFISYRRDETAYPAGWLYDRLADHFGAPQIFKDVDSIQLGDDFVQVINRAVGSCDVLLALIGAQWLSITDVHGRRLDDPNDFVRLEIEAALTRNVRIIPILVAGAKMPRADELPVGLAGLARRQALELSPSRFDYDLSRLLKVLDMTLADVRTVMDTAATTSPAAANAPDLSTTPASEGSVFAPLKRERKPAKPAAEPPSAGTVKDLLLSLIRIPAGPFRRNGTHTVTLPLFWIAKYPVTNERYALFVSMTGRQPPRGWDGVEPPPELLDHPVVNVSWAAANAYCAWVSNESGLTVRLPTGDEWEKAARGTDNRKYPWGNTFDPARTHTRSRRTAAVTAHVPAGDSPYGVSDMVGNAREWTADLHDGLVEVRGGGFLYAGERVFECGHRDLITTNAKASIGFRIACS
ncbi:MAG TPA: SUMF1/EgtB/PvdO family nonheme iron enzyme [Propionibacteriaceae bacterium]